MCPVVLGWCLQRNRPMISRLATSLAIAVFRGLGLLPLSLLQKVGMFLGWVGWIMPGSYKRRAAKNMAYAYPNPSISLQRESMQQLLCMFLELPYLWAPRNANRITELISCDEWPLIDRTLAEGDGVYAPFFGQSAYTITLVQRMQAVRQTPVFTVGLERLPKAQGYHFHVVPMEAPLSTDPVVAATEMNAALENMIHRMPSQYLWGYNRYKSPRTTKD